MSFPALLWALGFDKKCKGKVSKPTNLSAPEKAVLICLADHHNQTTGECFPSFNRIAGRPGYAYELRRLLCVS